MSPGKPLQGGIFKGLYRYRYGSYRIIYAIDRDSVIILILRIAPHTTSSSDTSVSIPRDTCISISYGSNTLHLPLFASYAVNFERFTAGRLPCIPGIVKLWESPGIAGGLLRRNQKNYLTES